MDKDQSLYRSLEQSVWLSLSSDLSIEGSPYLSTSQYRAEDPNVGSLGSGSGRVKLVSRGAAVVPLGKGDAYVDRS